MKPKRFCVSQGAHKYLYLYGCAYLCRGNGLRMFGGRRKVESKTSVKGCIDKRGDAKLCEQRGTTNHPIT